MSTVGRIAHLPASKTGRNLQNNNQTDFSFVLILSVEWVAFGSHFISSSLTQYARLISQSW